MGIWRSKKEFRAPSIGLDEFDPFPFESLEFEGTRISSIQKPAKSIHVDNRSIPSGSRSIQRIKSYFVYFVLAVATIASGFFVSKLKPWEMWATQEFVYAYFEVRALDQSGRPVAGALVKNSGKKVGTTDSFGEWRRYMKVPLGSTIPISVVKNHNGVSASAIKNFAVPPSRPDKADIELRSSIQLAAITPVAVSAVAQSDSVVVEKAEVAAKELNVSDKMPDASPVETATAISVSKPLANVENQLFQSSHESIWFETTADRKSVV